MVQPPKDLTRRGLIATCVMTAGLSASRLFHATGNRQQSHFALRSTLPPAFPRWRAIDADQSVIPDADETKAVTGAYEESVSRTYVRDDGAMVMLVVAHGRPDSGLIAIHRAETCYSAQGFDVQGEGHMSLAMPYGKIRATRMFATRGDRSEPVLYWASIAGEQTETNIEQKFRLLRAAWNGQAADAFLVRASCLGPNDGASFARISRFLSGFLDACSSDLRKLLAA